MKQILEILDKLVGFKSVTPRSAGSIEYIASLLTQAGFTCDIQVFGETDEEKTTNLYAKYGSKSPNICFAGHVDVVPPMNEELWNYDPFKLTIDEEKLYGRGTVDMKGAIAVSLAAALTYIKNNSNPDGSISFLLTSDEECSGKYGTKAMLEYVDKKGEKIDFTILGEPTSENHVGDVIKIGRRGSINFALTVMGKQGHAAYPEKASNPVTSLVKIASDLIKVDFDNGSAFFDKTNLQITTFDVGNNVTNIIPEKASIKFNVRFNDLHDAKSVLDIVMGIIANHEVIFDLKYDSSSNSFIQEYTRQMQKFADIVKKECKMEPLVTTNGGTSDARFIHKYSPVVEFGLNSNEAHKINEHTKISDLQTLYNVYYTSLNEFLGK
jgi:succinyl-diaminopimelate desuccinylase